MGTGRSYAGVTALDGKLYAMGGERRFSEPCDATYVFDSVECYDPSTDRWTYMPEMRPDGRYRGRGVSVAALGGKLYAVGGTDGFGDPIAGKQVDCFDPSTGEWSHQPPTRTSVAFNARAGVAVL
jgi:hypothetical protein